MCRDQRAGGDVNKMASNNANVVAFPDLTPKGSGNSAGGKRGLMGPEIGTLDRV